MDAPPGATRRAACEHARGESGERASNAAELTTRDRFRNVSLTAIYKFKRLEHLYTFAKIGQKNKFPFWCAVFLVADRFRSAIFFSHD